MKFVVSLIGVAQARRSCESWLGIFIAEKLKVLLECVCPRLQLAFSTWWFVQKAVSEQRTIESSQRVTQPAELPWQVRQTMVAP